jgi:hypothetical protein
MGAFAEMICCSNQYTDRSPYMTAVFPKGATINLEGRLRGLTIACESGIAWVTQLGDARDHVLGSYRTFTAGMDEQVVVQILEDARITFRLGGRKACDLLLSMTAGRYIFAIRPIPIWKLYFPALQGG